MHETNLLYHCKMQEFNVGEIVRKLKKELESKYGNEAASLSFILIEEVLGVTREDILLNETVTVNTDLHNKLNECLQQLLSNVPIQHILGWADFYGHRFKVNSSTLIPRQETEELVDHVAKLIASNSYNSLLDIGTGSGCIPISLILENKNLEATAIEISALALEVARLNAENYGVDLKLIQADIFDYNFKGSYDVIVSNPPYVLESERELMQANVLEYDPAKALFVDDANPLIFYKRIIELSANHLNANGLLYFEINEKFGVEVAGLMYKNHFSDVSITNDLNGKNRFVFGFNK